MRRVALVAAVALSTVFAVAWIANFLKDSDGLALLREPVIWAEIVVGSALVGGLTWLIIRVFAWAVLGFFKGPSA